MLPTKKYNDDKFTKVYDEVKKLITYLAKNNNSDAIGMEFDDIVQELNIEVINMVKKYEDKEVAELVLICKRILYNRIAELKYKYYLTYRNPAKYLALDDITNFGDKDTYKFSDIRDLLSEKAKEVYDEVFCEGARLNNIMMEVTIRAYENYSNPNVHVKVRHISQAVNMKPVVVKSCLFEIKSIMEKECV